LPLSYERADATFQFVISFKETHETENKRSTMNALLAQLPPGTSALAITSAMA
jgi:hypothetical protein